jgi:hypothetical protein
MSHFDWPIPPKIILKLWRLSKIEVSILKLKILSASYPFGPPIYTGQKKYSFGQSIWDKSDMPLETSLGTHSIFYKLL